MSKFSISMITNEQLQATTQFIKARKTSLQDKVCRLIVSSDLILENADAIKTCQSLKRLLPDVEFVLSLPEILRMEDHAYLRQVEELFGRDDSIFDGIISGSLEGIGYFVNCKKRGIQLKIYGDHNLYLWNAFAVDTWREMLDGGCLPLELRASDQEKLLSTGFSFEKIVYGRIPMMLTANCVAKTNNACRKAHPELRGKELFLKDRMGKSLPVRLNCGHCFNVIYNSVPLSLHEEMHSYAKKALLRLSLTTENAAETGRILTFFLFENFEGGRPPYSDFTKGHEKKGAT